MSTADMGGHDHTKLVHTVWLKNHFAYVDHVQSSNALFLGCTWVLCMSTVVQSSG